MSISTEGKLSLWLSLIGLAAAGATIVFPQNLWIGVSLLTFFSLSAIGLLYYHICERLRFSWKAGHKRRMLALAGIVLSALCLLLSIGAFVWAGKAEHGLLKNPAAVPPEAPPSRAETPSSRVEVLEADEWHLPSADRPGKLNINTKTAGLNPITNFRSSGDISIVYGEMPEEQINSQMDRQVYKNDHSEKIFYNQLQQNHVFIIPFDLFPGLQTNIEDVFSGKARIYLFLAMSYNDATSADFDRLITTEYCVYFESSLSPPFFCRLRNRIYYRTKTPLHEKM